MQVVRECIPAWDHTQLGKCCYLAASWAELKSLIIVVNCLNGLWPYRQVIHLNKERLETETTSSPSCAWCVQLSPPFRMSFYKMVCYRLFSVSGFMQGWDRVAAICCTVFLCGLLS